LKWTVELNPGRRHGTQWGVIRPKFKIKLSGIKMGISAEIKEKGGKGNFLSSPTGGPVVRVGKGGKWPSPSGTSKGRK